MLVMAAVYCTVLYWVIVRVTFCLVITGLSYVKSGMSESSAISVSVKFFYIIIKVQTLSG
jgi:hypothetical protein